MMILYSGPTCPFSQMSRIILNEKGCDFQIESIDVDGYTENESNVDLAQLTPYGELPVLLERDLLLYNVFVVNEYIDERFPHPQLMPTDPVGRARSRLFLHVIEREIFPHIRTLENSKASPERKEHARLRLRENLVPYRRNQVPALRRFRHGRRRSLADPLAPRVLRHRIACDGWQA